MIDVSNYCVLFRLIDALKLLLQDLLVTVLIMNFGLQNNKYATVYLRQKEKINRIGENEISEIIRLKSLFI